MIGRFPPLRRAEDVFHGRVLVVAPHPDDEVIAAGGSIALLSRRGRPIRCVHLTDGAQGDPQGHHGDIRDVRSREGRTALAGLGVEDVQSGDFVDGTLRARLDDATSYIREQIEAFRPAHVLAPSPFEAHHDHIASASAAGRAAHGNGVIESIDFYGVNTPVPANVLVDISAAVNDKMKALEAYASQLAYIDFRPTVRAADIARTVNIELPEIEACEAFLRVRPEQFAALARLASQLADIQFPTVADDER